MLDTEGLTAAAVSRLLELGIYETVNGGELSTMPGNGLRAALWLDRIQGAAAASGLGAVSIRLALKIRIYGNIRSEPVDEIDPDMLRAVDKTANAFVAGFTFNGEIRNVDVFGAHGQDLFGQAGYVDVGDGVCRIVDLTLPLIINDVWTLEA